MESSPKNHAQRIKNTERSRSVHNFSLLHTSTLLSIQEADFWE